jgi:hypothetical protein
MGDRSCVADRGVADRGVADRGVADRGVRAMGARVFDKLRTESIIRNRVKLVQIPKPLRNLMCNGQFSIGARHESDRSHLSDTKVRFPDVAPHALAGWRCR